MSYQRINKNLSHYGICSRRKVEILIKEKEVLNNWLYARLDMKVNFNFDNIFENAKKAKSCIIKIIEDNHKNFILRIEFKEGINKQIRKISSLLVYKVLDLKIIGVGKIFLSNLEGESWRLINDFNYGDFL